MPNFYRNPAGKRIPPLIDEYIVKNGWYNEAGSNKRLERGRFQQEVGKRRILSWFKGKLLK